MEMSLWSFHHIQELIGGKFLPDGASNPEFFICASRGIERTIGGAVRGLLRAHVMTYVWSRKACVWAQAFIGMGWRPTPYIQRFLNMIFSAYIFNLLNYIRLFIHMLSFF